LKIARVGAGLAGLLISCWNAAAPAADCAGEAAVLAREQSELPRLEVASPADRPPYCITLETVMAFAGRVRTHLARCPNSDFAAAAADWSRTRNDYAKLFSRYRCRRTR
jgi:hypothetical protein